MGYGKPAFIQARALCFGHASPRPACGMLGCNKLSLGCFFDAGVGMGSLTMQPIVCFGISWTARLLQDQFLHPTKEVALTGFKFLRVLAR